MWCASSRVLRSKRPLPCTSLSGQGIGGSLFVYRPILERGRAEVCINTTVRVAGMVVETDNNEVAPYFRSSAGGTDASLLSVPLWVPLFDWTGGYGLGVSLVLEMLTSMSLVTKTLKNSSR